MKGRVKTFDEFINENYHTDPLYNIAAEVYDMIDYKDLENKTKIKSALKKLGHGTDSITVGRVMRKIQQVINERVNENKGSKYLPYKTAKEIAMRAGGRVIDAEDDMKELFISYDNGEVPKKEVKKILKKYDLQDLLDEYGKRLNESNWDIDELKTVIKDLQNKIKKQGRVTNTRDEEHLERLLGIYKELTGESLKESREYRTIIDKTKYIEAEKEEKFINYLQEIGYTTDSILKHGTLQDLIYSIDKADIQRVENFVRNLTASKYGKIDPRLVPGKGRRSPSA